eukprot:TRINITY_DN11877_c0_g1_i2.p1 TRINITY_DN11877_c0_g1~~TRINITY_DN11877_c0_g1_i2.p1  ORF type:complete len:335 (-),score=54.33 TRINITY_DN11877_c0_g1_i2:156-1160(-)
MCIRDSPLPDQADPAPAEAADVPAPAEAEAAAAPAAPPKASKKIVYKTKTSTVKSSMKARLWKDVVFCTIEVVDPHLQQEAVCTMPACGGADKKAMRKINIFDAVREYKNVAFVKKILHESEQGDQEAAMLNEDSKTPDFYVSGRETEEDREIYRVLSKAISRTILKYAESGEWDKLLEILPSFANSRDKGDLSEFLRGRDALSPHGWTALHLATRRNMYSHAIILAESRADLEQKDLMVPGSSCSLIVLLAGVHCTASCDCKWVGGLCQGTAQGKQCQRPARGQSACSYRSGESRCVSAVPSVPKGGHRPGARGEVWEDWRSFGAIQLSLIHI